MEAISFIIHRDIKEVPCDHEQFCGAIHRIVTGVERYRLNGRFVTQQQLLAAVHPWGYNLEPDPDSGHLVWGDLSMREMT